ncbi:MAG: cupin domain-containing protein [Verrucomicrobia bacterium]|nr:cupin domain-containing protein [Verrucomicrobiota bacterium]MDA1065028.1 cupin domain-containing protein [Verrucomicrobiota bacterium]
MKQNSFAWIILSCIAFYLIGCAKNSNEDSSSDSVTELKLENLMSSALEGANGKEIIVSRVSIPPNTSLPKHWHPGEEFAYVLEGSVVLWQKGKADVVCNVGEVAKVPFKQIHTAMTGDEGATIVVFRVHEHGEPERVLVE